MPSVRRQSGQVKTSSVGRFAHVLDAARASSMPPPDPACARQQADRQVGAGPAEADRVERERVELRAAALAGVSTCSRQAATGSGSSRRTAVRDRLPEPLDVRLAEHLQRLALGRVGGDRPVDRPLVLAPAAAASSPSTGRALPTRSWSRSARSSGSGSPAIMISAPPSASASTRASTHGGRLGQVVVGGVLDEARLRTCVVDVADVDVARACRVAGAGDRADERRVLDERASTKTVWPGWTFAPTRTIRSA